MLRYITYIILLIFISCSKGVDKTKVGDTESTVKFVDVVEATTSVEAGKLTKAKSGELYIWDTGGSRVIMVKR